MTQNESIGLLLAGVEDPVIILCSMDGAFASWHPSVLTQFGYSADEFTGRRMDLLDAASDALSEECELREAHGGGRPRRLRCLTRKDGSRLQVEIETFALRGQGGEFAGFGRILRDVTALKRAQEEAASLAGALNRSNMLIRPGRCWPATGKMPIG